MATIEEIQIYSDVSIELLDPEDLWVLDKSSASRLLTGGTASYIAYYTAADTTMTVLASTGATVVIVEDTSGYVIGDIIELRQDDGTFHRSVISTVTASTFTITFLDPTTAAVGVGQPARRPYSSSGISMAEFGTAKVDDCTWGYRAGLDNDGAYQVLDNEFTVDITLDAGAGLALTKTICYKVVKDCA